jgi:hypothetical protein
MGLALDEPKAEDKKYEVEGLSFVIDKDVTDALTHYGNVSIDYQDRPFFAKGFQVSLTGARSCS